MDDTERNISKEQIRDKTRDRAVRSARRANLNPLPLQNSFCSITCFPPFSLCFFHVVNDASFLLFILAFFKDLCILLSGQCCIIVNVCFNQHCHTQPHSCMLCYLFCVSTHLNMSSHNSARVHLI